MGVLHGGAVGRVKLSGWWNIIETFRCPFILVPMDLWSAAAGQVSSSVRRRIRSVLCVER